MHVRSGSRHKWHVVAAALALISASIGLALTAGQAAAATTPGYPLATVDYMASTRTLPYLRSSTYWGYALPNQGASSGRQTVSISCWYDADWANGTNRWFRVLVWENYDGYGTPRWLFVNASYVHNTATLRKCYATGSGIW